MPAHFLRFPDIIFLLLSISTCGYSAFHINQNDGLTSNPSSELNAIHPVIEEGVYGKEYSFDVSRDTEYTIQYRNVSKWKPNQTARINVESESASTQYPVLIVVRQQKGILSWQLPLTVGTHLDVRKEFKKVSRTLCPSKYYVMDGAESVSDNDEIVIASVSSSSPVNVTVKLLVVIIEDFFLELSTPRNITVSPAEPHFYGFNFNANLNSALLLVDSDDDICTTVSVQTISCPVFDLERNVQFEGQWETMQTKGAITIMKESYPLGLYVVFVVKGDDWECTGKPQTEIHNRNKSLSFVLKPGISEKSYWLAVGTTVLLFLLFYIISGVVLLFHVYGRPSLPIDSGIITSEDSIDEPIVGSEELPRSSSVNHRGSVSPTVSDSSLDEDDIDVMLDVESDKNVYRTKTTVTVADLSRKSSRALQMKSQQYLWSLLTVGMFYALPVVQLVVTYQTVLWQTGNQDLCYYNFRCAHPFYHLSDFNHVFSNVGYGFHGFLFILITAHRERVHKRRRLSSDNYGIPQHFGLFYAMGAALIVEGILSASYHVCPNRSNFQFDTSFMYVMAVLCMVKIYQNRHPDINARAYATFSALAGVTFIGMWGILGPSTYFWIVFTAMHIIACIVMSSQIYYMRWKIEITAIKRVMTMWFSEFRHAPLQSLTPNYPNRMVLLVLGNLCNWGLAGYGITYLFSNFATFLLAIFMANLLLYCFYYIVMKLCYKEKILLQPSIYILLSFTAWGVSLFFFMQHSISWKLTPAESRTYNQECLILDFYDKHDVWHFLSASSMFFSFMVLLTLDDDLVKKPRKDIPVF